MEDERRYHTDLKRISQKNCYNNYRPIKYLPMMWKILTAQIRKELQDSPTNCGLFPEEQKGCHEGFRCMGEQLYIDQYILRKSDETEKSSYGLDWMQKGIWQVCAKLDNKL